METTTSSLAERTRRHAAFWQRDPVDRPLFGTTSSYFPRTALAAVSTQGRPLNVDDIDLPALLEACDKEYREWGSCAGDLVWAAAALRNFPWIPAMLGCPVYRGEDAFWREPCLADWSQLEKARVTPDNPWLRCFAAVTTALVEHARGRYPVGPSLVLGPISFAADLCGPNAFAFALHDEPEVVDAAIGLCTDASILAARAQAELLPCLSDGSVNPNRQVWAPGWTIETQEDEAFMFSPARHRRHLMAPQARMGAAFPYTYIHLHGTQLHTLPNLLEIDELRAIEITPDYNQSVLDIIPAVRMALERKPVIVHGFLSMLEIRGLLEALPARGLCIAVRRDTPAEAREVLAQVPWCP